MKISLKAARVNAGMTQAVAASNIGVSLSTIKLWEAGKTFPSQPMIEKMCEVYDVQYDQLKFFCPKVSLKLTGGNCS